MKKIFSILLAVSVVLGLFAAAVPAMADVEGPVDDNPTVTFVGAKKDCAGCGTVMNITFNISAIVETGMSICIDFPDDTSVPPTGADWKNGDITIQPSGKAAKDVLGAEVTVSSSTHGTEVCFVNPGADLLPADNPHSVVFTSNAGIVNPTTPGKYTLFVWTTRPADDTPVESHEYVIKPYYSTYKWTWDSSPTYPGLAPGFVPPFKMCGQNNTGTNATPGTWNASIPGFLNAFNITFEVDEEGCFAPCDNVTLSFHLKEVPAEDCEMTLCINATCWTLDDTDVCVDIPFAKDIALNATAKITFNASAHFECKGDYQLCFLAECVPAACAPPCCPPPELPEENFTIKVYQWKEACKIPIYRKWNLISLPLVPLTDPAPEVIFSALPDWDKEIISVWYYDRGAPDCDGGQWLCYAPSADTDLPAYCDTLANMEDGPAYWVRVAYTPTDPPGTKKGMGTLLGYLWVWGTAKPVPPNSPSNYPVCDGWNMVGFTEGCFPSLPFGGMWDATYLWNWILPAWPWFEYGAVAGWDASAQTWDAVFQPGWVWMKPGKGYWISFKRAGTVNPP